MYTPWLSPSEISPSTFSGRLGGRLSGRGDGLRVAIIGLDGGFADQVRIQLFGHYWDFGDLSVGDLGNLRKPTPQVAIPLLRELLQAGVVPLLIGSEERLLAAQYQAFAELNRPIGLCVVDQYISLHPGTLDAAVDRDRLPVFHLTHIGSQRHVVDPGLRQLFQRRSFERYGLGRARAGLRDLEPPIRDAEIITINIGALTRQEAPAQAGLHASGFSLLEAGQLAYYAGASDRLSSFGLFGYQGEEAEDADRQLTAAAYAQLAWYFLHGVSQRTGDFPVTTEGLVAYATHAGEIGELTFWKSRATGRWWLEVPGNGPAPAGGRLVACSETDYLEAVKEGRMSERLFTAFSRF
jgi:hypothetical protein